MKKMIFTVLLMSSTSFAVNRESGGMYGPSAIYVDFQSFGNGIDQSALRLFKKDISYARAKGLIEELTYESYGYEGEVRTCVLFRDVMVQRGFVERLEGWILADTKANPRMPRRTKLNFDSHCK